LAAWLLAHPGIHVISRDRSGEYADGARLGAPRARQVADRFHLLQNLRDVVRRILKRHAPLGEQVLPPESDGAPLTRWRLDREASRERTRTAMQERFAVIQRLTHEGMSISAIARASGCIGIPSRSMSPAPRRHGDGIRSASQARSHLTRTISSPAGRAAAITHGSCGARLRPEGIPARTAPLRA
jgi:Transposase